MIRRKTIIHWLIAGTVCILAAAMLLILRHVAGNTANQPAQTTQQETASGNTENGSISSALQRGPFYLKITTSRFGEKSYQSFEIYFANSDSSDAIFSCGRKFPADEVQSIGWSSDGYDVVVRLRGGSSVTYPYDGISTWQQ